MYSIIIHVQFNIYAVFYIHYRIMGNSPRVCIRQTVPVSDFGKQLCSMGMISAKYNYDKLSPTDKCRYK